MPHCGEIRVRTGRGYCEEFTILHGQRNARFVRGPMLPFRRMFSWGDAFSVLPESGFDAFHSFNAVPLLPRRPYIVTFGDFMPRTPTDRRVAWLERTLRDMLLKPRCVALVACSEYALRQFRWQHRDFPRLPELLAKTEMIHPATPVRRQAPKRASDHLRLLFVGRDFMRKGGPVLLRAHARLRKAGVPVETTIVSSLGWSRDDYVGPPDEAYVLKEHAQVAQDGVVHHASLPNAEVKRLMDEADYLVFPTIHDIFGYVSIEALASATPVIATDTCSMPEVVEHGVSGFLLPFENDPDVGKWTWLYRNAEPGYFDAYEAATAQLAEALHDRLAALWEGRADYEALSQGALDRAKAKFDEGAARLRLEKLYERLRVA